MYVQISKSDSHHSGLLLLYSDPDVLLYKKESWPPSAILRDAIKQYLRYQRCPEVTFISLKEGDEDPFVLSGFLRFEDENTLFLNKNGDEYQVLLSKFKEANSQLVAAFNEQDMLPVLLQPTGQAGTVIWKPQTVFRRSFSGKDFVQSWVGGLALLYGKATMELVKLLQLSHTNLEEKYKAVVQVPPNRSQNWFLIYWACSKPRNLASWLSYQWQRNLDFQKLQEVYQEYHPINCGWYRFRMFDAETTDGDTSVHIIWQAPMQLQYSVEITEGSGATEGEDVGEEYCVDGSHRARLTIQNKLVAPNSSCGKPDGTWELRELFNKDFAYTVSCPEAEPPCLVTPFRYNDANIDFKDWEAQIFGPGEDIPQNILSKFNNEAEIGFKQLWRTFES